MKGWLSIFMFLAVVIVVCTARAQEPQMSLGDVARQSRSEKQADPKFTWSDQADSVPVSQADSSVCGSPLTRVQELYVQAWLGQSLPPEEEIADALIAWLDGHPALEAMDPEDLAKIEEPRTSVGMQADQKLADDVAQTFVDQMVELRKTRSEMEIQQLVAKALYAQPPQRQADVVESAVREEKQRRAKAAGAVPSREDRVREAASLYAICENKRMAASQGKVENLVKIAMRLKLEAAGFTIPEEPASPGNAPNAPESTQIP